jgi:putative membrane protein
VLTPLVLTGSATHVGGVWLGGLGFFLLLAPLFWVALVTVIFSVGRRRRAAWFAQGGGYGHPGFGGGLWGGHWGGPSRSAESTLAERFAQGDVDEQDYRARLEALRANAWPQRPVK